MVARGAGRPMGRVLLATAWCWTVVGCLRVVLAPATFPRGEGPWEAPLVDQSSGAHLEVPVRLEQEEGGGTRRMTLRAILDTGLGRTVVPAFVAGELGLATFSTSTRIRDTAGRHEDVRAAVVSAVQLGELTLTKVPVAIAEGASQVVIGYDILSRVAFEADLDHGMVVFGGAPLTSEEGAEVVDLRCLAASRAPLVDVAMGGGVVRMSLDTGAHVSTIDATTARELGLRRRYLPMPRRIHYLSSDIILDHVYRVDELVFGGVRVETVDLAPTTALPSEGFDLQRTGLLGMDVLGRFRFRFDPTTCRLSVWPRSNLPEP